MDLEIFRLRRRPIGLAIFAFIANFCLVAFLLSLLITDGSKAPDSEIGWIGVAVFAYLGCRSLVVSVEVRGQWLIIRSWWRTNRIPVSDVTYIGYVDHFGILLKSSLGGLLQMLVVDSMGRQQEFPAIGGTSRRLDRIVEDVSRAVARCR